MKEDIPLHSPTSYILILLYAAPCLIMPARAERRFPLGIVQDFVWTKEEEVEPLIKLAKEAGASHVRICIRWSVVEPKRGQWDFTHVDSVVRKLRKAKLGIFAILVSVPSWANGTEGKKVEGWYDTYPPDSTEDWASYIRAVVSRYKIDIKLWEIWNEENGVDFWRPVPDVKRYVGLLIPAYQECKRADPKCTVLLGSLQMNGVIPNPWSPVKTPDYLQRLYDAGAKRFFDAINIHPYVLPREGAEYMGRMIRDTVEVARKNGDGKKPIWVTEIGCGINASGTAEDQAKLLEESFDVLACIPQVKGAFWFCLRDYDADMTGPEASMGIVSKALAKKPSFEAFQRISAKYAAR